MAGLISKFQGNSLNWELLFFVFIIICFFIAGCESNSHKGYWDGWDNKKDIISYLISTEYKKAYEQGKYEAYLWDAGCSDRRLGKSPQNPDYQIYMNGYDRC